jgi:hypothetical protein
VRKRGGEEGRRGGGRRGVEEKEQERRSHQAYQSWRKQALGLNGTRGDLKKSTLLVPQYPKYPTLEKSQNPKPKNWYTCCLTVDVHWLTIRVFNGGVVFAHKKVLYELYR